VPDLAAAIGGIARRVSAVMGGPYSAARIVEPGRAGRSARHRPCSAQVDAATEAMRLGDFTEEDRRILVLRDGLDGEVTTDDRIRILAGPYAGSLWAIVPPVASDPVAAYYELHGRPCG
jgi:hypothetical protein